LIIWETITDARGDEMNCYKDKTFCNFLKCSEKDCVERLTDKIKKDAQRFGLPICQYMDKPDCYKDVKK
jgi:hypothetical protein